MEKKSLNRDSYEIKNYEVTPEGYLKFWMVAGIPGKELVYDGGRKEFINKDYLFDEKSIASAVGKPVCLNHPPRPINSKNYLQFSKGTLLQEYSDDENGSLVLSGIVHDGETVEKILKGEVKYVSASYTADKIQNDDGIFEQRNRKYNHIALLTEDFSPRAGENSKIVMHFEEMPIQKDEQEVVKETPSQNIDAGEIEQRVEILASWKEILEKNNIAIDYNEDSKTLKRKILRIFYPEETIKALNNDSVLEGFWLNFISQAPASINEDGNRKDLGYGRKNSPHAGLNFDSEIDSIRNQFIAKMENR